MKRLLDHLPNSISGVATHPPLAPPRRGTILRALSNVAPLLGGAGGGFMAAIRVQHWRLKLPTNLLPNLVGTRSYQFRASKRNLGLGEISSHAIRPERGALLRSTPHAERCSALHHPLARPSPKNRLPQSPHSRPSASSAGNPKNYPNGAMTAPANSR
jgi:hypothetical protein